MSDDRPKRQTMSIEEATISNMWEIAAIHCRRACAPNKTSTTSLPSCASRIPAQAFLRRPFPEPDLLTETENMIIDDILALLNKHGLTSHQSQNLLERLGSIIEIGQRLAKGTTH